MTIPGGVTSRSTNTTYATATQRGTSKPTVTSYTTNYNTGHGTSKATATGYDTNVTTGHVTLRDTQTAFNTATNRSTATNQATNTVVYERLTATANQTEVTSGSAHNGRYWDGSQWTED